MGYHYFDDDEGRVKYSPGVFESFEKAISGAVIGVADLMGKGIVGLLIIGCVGAILFLTGAFLLGRMGIIKADFNVTMAPSISAEVLSEEVSIVTVSHQKKPKVIVTPVAEEGVTSFEASTRCQSVFLSWDGMMYDYGAYIIPGLFGDTNIECSLEPNRAVLVSFVDGNGGTITPESLQITDGESNCVGCTSLGNGVFAFFLPEDASDMALTFLVEGYAPVTVTQDWNSFRLGELEVLLNG